VKGRKHSPEQIIRKLREADQLAGQGQDVAAVAKALVRISEQSDQSFRSNPITHFAGIRSGISGQSDQLRGRWSGGVR
jgi:hypothetical protein